MTSNVEITEKFLEECVAKWIKEEEELGYETVIRQYNLGDYGIIDIVAMDLDWGGEFVVDIFELKKGAIDEKAVMQILRYRAGMNKLLNKILLTPFRLSCHLVGAYISERIKPSIEGLEDFLTCWEYKFSYNGFKLYFGNYNKNFIPGTVKTIRPFVCYDYQVHDGLADLMGRKDPDPYFKDYIPENIKKEYI